MSKDMSSWAKWEDRNENVIFEQIEKKNKILGNEQYSYKKHWGYSFGFARYQNKKKSFIDFAIFKNNKPYIFIECKEQLVAGSTHEKVFGVSLNAQEITFGNHTDYFVISSHTNANYGGFNYLNEQYKNEPADKIRNFHSLSTGEASLIALKEFLENVL